MTRRIVCINRQACAHGLPGQTSGPQSTGIVHLPKNGLDGGRPPKENMRLDNRLPCLWLSLAASSLVLLPALSVHAQNPAKPEAAKPAETAKTPEPATP